VQVQVVHGEVEVELSVSPIEATVLTHFQSKARVVLRINTAPTLNLLLLRTCV
jgi:hypothetical protein